jgi:nitrite reductase (NO-forming)
MQEFNFKRATNVLVAASCVWAFSALATVAAADAALPVIIQELVAPPGMPAPITRKTAARVVVNLTVEEVEKEIAPGTRYMFWTFGGTVPGKMIRVREGDTVELHLKNLASNKLPHNIDLHAVTGPGGGAAQTLIAPGNEATFSFKALSAGLYVYHCATAPVGMHVANGMYGMILVEPKEGMRKVDREYYVMQGDFYTSGAYRAEGLQNFDMQKAMDEKPTYVLFNGADGALTGKSSLTANSGEKVRMFFGVGGPNLVSSFHIIGAIFDRVYGDGGSYAQEHVQTALVPPGGSTIVEFVPKVPGNLTMVDHSLTRAFNKGAVGLLAVSGPPQPEIYSQGIKTPLPLLVGTPVKTVAVAAPASTAPLARGKSVYERICAACHLPDGSGVAGVFPPLENSDFFQERPYEMAHIVMHGRSGELVVNGEHYNGVMPAQDLNDEDIAAVINYINVDMNQGKPVLTAEQVKAMRQIKPQQ